MPNPQLEQSAVRIEIEPRSHEVREIPARAVEVIRLGLVISAKSEVQLASRAMQHLPSTHGRKSPVWIGGMRGRRQIFVGEALRSGQAKGAELPATVVQL